MVGECYTIMEQPRNGHGSLLWNSGDSLWRDAPGKFAWNPLIDSLENGIPRCLPSERETKSQLCHPRLSASHMPVIKSIIPGGSKMKTEITAKAAESKTGLRLVLNMATRCGMRATFYILLRY